MNLHQLAQSIVDALWHNSLDEIRDGIDKDYRINLAASLSF